MTQSSLSGFSFIKMTTPCDFLIQGTSKNQLVHRIMSTPLFHRRTELDNCNFSMKFRHILRSMERGGKKFPLLRNMFDLGLAVIGFHFYFRWTTLLGCVILQKVLSIVRTLVICKTFVTNYLRIAHLRKVSDFYRIVG